MRIILIGQAAFGEAALRTLIGHGEEIAHVFTPPDPPSGKPDPLAARARELELPLTRARSFKGDAVYEHFRSLKADLAVLAFVTAIIPERILYAPRLKSICFHPSLLPRHRGASAINWALIHGDTETGVTWFWPGKEIDTGPILLQKRAPIEPDDTAGSLYFNRLFPLGIESLIEALELISEGKALAIAQDERFATYEPLCRGEYARVDFSKLAGELYNLVRGCDPKPGAWVETAGWRLRFYEPRMEVSDAGAPAGTIVGVDEGGMKIALNGGILLVRRVRLEPDGKKVAPAELAARGVLSAGLRLKPPEG